MRKKIDCNIIVDLLPLYYDNVVSKETKKAISEHIESCESCKKQFEKIAEELPKVNKNSTKEKFFQMLKKQKTKRIINIFIAVLFGIGISISALYIFTNEPLKTVSYNEIEILQAYVVETENSKEVFVWFSTPVYSGNTKITWDISNEETLKYDITQKVALLSSKQDEFGNVDRIYSFSLDDQYSDVEEIYFNDILIWSLDKNSDDVIPDYVSEYINSKNSISTTIYDYELGIFGIGYENTDVIYWDLDGNIIDN